MGRRRKPKFVTIREEYMGLVAELRIPLVIVRAARFDIFEVERRRLRDQLAAAWYRGVKK